MSAVKIWANSGDSHLMEPHDLFSRTLPAHLAERMPRSVRDDDGLYETIHVDGQEFRRKLPFAKREIRDDHGQSVLERAPGANDMRLRLKDLDDEGIWAELVYTSIGMWMHSIRDPELMAAGCRAINDWSIEFQRFCSRYVCTAMVPVLTVESAVTEIERAADLGFHVISLPVAPTEDGPDWHQTDVWEPVWAACEAASLVVGFHIGSDPHDASRYNGVYFRGPGGHLLNYMEASIGGQRAVAKLITSGVFERHPSLRAIVSEGGATWGPFLADRLDEAYRQHAAKVWPRLARPPSYYLYNNVFASFQHDPSAVLAATAMGWRNVCWGSDYPHIEGTFGHTQKTLHELFADLDTSARRRITKGAFEELFPHVPPAPDDGVDAGEGGGLSPIPFVSEPPVRYGIAEPVAPLVRRVVAPNPGPYTYHGTGSYIVGSGAVAVIDPGPDDHAHVEALLAALGPGERVSHVLVTHTHADHSPAARGLAAATGSLVCGFGPQLHLDDPDPTAVVFGDPEADGTEPGGQASAGRPAPRRGGDRDFRADVVLRDGDVIDGGDWALEAVHTPGHASNHLCYRLSSGGVLFTGDHVMGWSTSVVAPPDGSLGRYLASLESLLDGPRDRIYLPAHGPGVTDPARLVAALLDHRRERSRQILDVLGAGSATIAEVVPRLYADVGKRLWPAAASSVYAHVLHLRDLGLVEVDGEPPLRRSSRLRLRAGAPRPGP